VLNRSEEGGRRRGGAHQCGAGPSGQGAALGSGEALGPAYGERGGVRWLGINEVAGNIGECGGDGLPEANTTLVRTRCSGWPPSVVVHCVEATRAAPGERKGGGGGRASVPTQHRGAAAMGDA
jgi:hypothetical protein